MVSTCVVCSLQPKLLNQLASCGTSVSLESTLSLLYQLVERAFASVEMAGQPGQANRASAQAALALAP